MDHTVVAAVHILRQIVDLLLGQDVHREDGKLECADVHLILVVILNELSLGTE